METNGKIKSFFSAFRTRMRLPQTKVLLYIFLVVFVLWFVNKLDKGYLYELKMGVTYGFSTSGELQLDELTGKSEDITLKINAGGFSLINYMLFKKNVNINLEKVLEQKNGSLYWIPSKYKELISQSLNKGSFIDHFVTDTVFLNLSRIQGKKVPVSISGVKITYARGYDNFQPLRFVPEEVNVFGTKKQLDKIFEIETEKRQYLNLKEVMQDTLMLHMPQEFASVKIQPPYIALSVYPEAFTEKELDVKVTAANVPYGYRAKLFPAMVTVRFRVPVDKYEGVGPKDFEIQADVNSADSEGEIYPRLKKSPSFTKNESFDRQSLRYTLVKI